MRSGYRLWQKMLPGQSSFPAYRRKIPQVVRKENYEKSLETKQPYSFFVDKGSMNVNGCETYCSLVPPDANESMDRLSPRHGDAESSSTYKFTHPKSGFAPYYGALYSVVAAVDQWRALKNAVLTVGPITVLGLPRPPMHLYWAGTPFLKMLSNVVKANVIYSLLIGAPLECLENYRAVEKGKKTVGEAVLDGTVDVGIGFVSGTAGMALGAKIGGAFGTAVPIPFLGTAVGIVAGAAIGFGICYFLTEAKEAAVT
jgi:hypothetical protein